MEVDEIIRADIIAEMSNPEMPIEYGFHYSDSILEIRNAVNALELFDKWPDDGGYLDQDAFFVGDMMMWQRIKNHKKQQYKKENKG